MSEVRRHPPVDPKFAETDSIIREAQKKRYLEGLEGQSIEVVEARELIDNIKEAIGVFNVEVFKQFDIGPKTIHEYNLIINDILGRKDGISINEKDFRFIDYGRAFGESSTEQHPTIEANKAIIDHYAAVIKSSFRLFKVEVGPEQLEEFATRFVIFHELGHALQQSYGNANGYETSGDRLMLSKASVKHGVAKNYFGDGVRDSHLENERFPQSLAYELFATTTMAGLGLDSDVVWLIQRHMLIELRGQSFPGIELVLTNEDLTSDEKYKKLGEIAPEVMSNIGNIGYFVPYDSATLQRVFNLCP